MVDSPLLALPTELLVAVFSCSSSLSHVANLAASCKDLNTIWKEHISYIVNQVAPAAIPCYEDLRGLLANQGHLALGAQVLQISDVAQLVTTSKNVTELFTSFRDRVRANVVWDPQVPRVLSPSEESRFISAHYKLWGLMLLNNDEQQGLIASMDLEETCLLADFLCVFDPWKIHNAEIQRVMEGSPAAHRFLQQKIRQQRNKDFLKQHHRAYRPIEFTPYERDGRYAWWCDRQQEIFKKMLTGSLFHA
ncbi:uncharacterized protein N7496_005764 [Penicillium cataractarum]|uniref:F-box domain-containing protein n=1 Tax=Penicillium cataractarum TaxID=2100454 RepID=A0A9W9V5P3_9EURO|nr:uncharacterized protein N7496_005764 [Penicillium cataractarum]KAJ5369672.1 hypothetical protein N7496_005764 [Penicillium cataractarum]